MEERYDTYIGESYAAMERTNFYDAVYSPVILILNAVVVAVVMLLSASKPHGTDLLWNVCRNCGCGHQLYLTDILPGGEPRNGDSDDSVCDCRNPQDQ